LEHLPVVEGKEKGFLQHRVETTASGVILAKAGRNALYRISSSRKRETNFCGCSFPKKWRTEVRESLQSRTAIVYRSTKIRLSLILPLRESCWGVPSPNPAYAAYAAGKSLKIIFRIFQKQFRFTPCFSPISERTPRTAEGGFTMRKRYNTPHRSRVVKTRMTEEEYAEFAERLSAYNMSQAEFIRQAITGAAIRPIITVSPVNDELLAAVGKLTAEYGRIGGNLNQIARTLNEWHSPYPQLAGEVRAAVSDLAALKFEVLQKVGDAVGNIQTYQL